MNSAPERRVGREYARDEVEGKLVAVDAQESNRRPHAIRKTDRSRLDPSELDISEILEIPNSGEIGDFPPSMLSEAPGHYGWTVLSCPR